MTHYFLRKLLRLILILLLVTAVTFLLSNLLPGDVVLALLGNPAVLQNQYAIRHFHG